MIEFGVVFLIIKSFYFDHGCWKRGVACVVFVLAWLCSASIEVVGVLAAYACTGIACV